jgi:S-adenosylmethionine-diacylgycerolhomoserine-N-methlytransferase
MGLFADLPILWRLLRGLPAATTHQDRLDAFYRPQAERYDAFRERLLHGRSDLIDRLPLAAGGSLVELGGGTGRTLEFLGDRLDRLDRAWLVDLCPPLLAQAERRCAGHGWTRVTTVLGDACRWQPPAPVDAVICSYSLTMIPDWFAAIDNAYAMLRPGGHIAVVDFTVSRPHPAPGQVQHGSFTRHFWPLWFGHDGVHPHPDHLPYLHRRFQRVFLDERRSSVPWLPLVTAPYYLFIGQKPATP